MFYKNPISKILNVKLRLGCLLKSIYLKYSSNNHLKAFTQSFIQKIERFFISI
jgi:hypothetical protein